MFLKNYHFLFIMFLFLGSIIAVSSNSWFIAWLGLEINLMSFIPLIMSNVSNNSSEAAIKYFITQAFASIFIIVFSSSDLIFESLFNINIYNYMIFIALAIKSGIAPFHYWFPQVMNLLNWFNCFIMLVWQKIAPFILLSYFSSKELNSTLMIISALVGGIGGLNQTLIKLILTYSSIIHSSWMLMLISFNFYGWWNYFMIYSFLSSSVIISSYFMSLKNLSSLFSSQMNSIYSKFMFSFNMMSLGGLPPFLGFYAKMMAIILSLKFYSLYIIFFMIFMSLLSLFYYMKMIYMFSMNISSEKKIMCMNLNKTMMINLFLSVSVFFNWMVSILVLLN